MAYSSSTFLYGTPYNVFPQEDSFQNFSSSRFEETPYDLGLNLDPSLHVSPPVALPSQWNSPMIQRFQNDNQKLSFFNPAPPMHGISANNLVRPVAPVPPPSQGRHGSPVSSHEPSSCSSAQSPPGDSEIYTDNNPSTPPDVALFSPLQSQRLDPWDPSAQYFQLAGVRAFPTETCVNMAEINPSQETYHEFESQSPLSLQRSFTYESQASSTFEADALTIQTMDYSIKRMASPDEIQPAIKEEIRITHPVQSHKGSKSAYPPPDPDDDDDLDEEPTVTLKAEDDDDDENWEPDQKRQKRTSAGTTTRRGPKPKRQSKSIEKATPKRPKIGGASSQPAKILPPSPAGSKGNLSCVECSLSFKDQTGLESHVKKQHTRPFICVFNFAGCDSTFASKNEWKRHVSSQHLLLHYWLCTQDTCVHTKNGPPSLPSPQVGSKRSRGRGQDETINVACAPSLPNGAIFNRKDLYTQHLRRMHTPPHIKKATKTGKKASGSASHPDWDEHIRILQQTAIQERCKLPTHMICPVSSCKQVFNGADAWDQRMEHVARHLEKAANNREAHVVFGGPADPTLMQWCTSPSVGVVKKGADGKWVLNNPLKPEGGKDQRQTAAADSDPVVKAEIVVESGGEEDAEGDDEF